MTSFVSALEEMGKINADARKISRLKSISERVKLVLEIRNRYIAQVSAMMTDLNSDPYFESNPDIAREFSRKLNELRQTVAALQAKWRSSEMIAKYEVYSIESAPVARAAQEFVRWAKSARRSPRVIPNDN